MPTKSKAQVKADEDAGLALADAKAALAVAADYPSVLEQATEAFRALNALADAIRQSVPVRGKRAKVGYNFLTRMTEAGKPETAKVPRILPVERDKANPSAPPFHPAKGDTILSSPVTDFKTEGE